MLWGNSLQFWQTVVFWLWAVTAASGAIAVAASFGASVVSYYISDATETAARIAIDQAKAVAGQAQEAAAEANARASEADLARAKLETRLAPRKLTDEQKALLKKAFDSENVYQRIDVISEGNPEATYYASQFVEFFHSIGLKSDLRIDYFMSGPTPPGPFQVRKDPVGSIRRALTTAGSEPVGTTDYEGDEEPSFIVAPRPIDE